MLIYLHTFSMLYEKKACYYLNMPTENHNFKLNRQNCKCGR